jgi:serine/threonine-protein kinase
VSAVLEGSVRRAGNRLRVTAQLTNVADGFHIWSERYDREMADVFAIQDEIVEAIVKAIAPALAGDAKHAVYRPTENLEAYELYLKGRHHWHQRTPSTMQSALRCFEQVIALDPDYALAHAGLADCYAICRGYAWYSDAQSREPARVAITRAMELDPSLADVNFSQGFYLTWLESNFPEAQRAFRRAIEINPRMAPAYGYLALVLVAEGRFEEALVQADKARELDPLSAFGQYLAGFTYSLAGRFEMGERISRRVLELQPDSLTGLWPLGLALSGLGRDAESVGVVERAVMLSRAPFYVGQLGFVYARVGRAEDARRLLGELSDRADRGEYISPAAPLFVHVGLGDADAIRASLQACLADVTPVLTIQVTSGPFLPAFRTDAGIARLMDELQRGPWPTP